MLLNNLTSGFLPGINIVDGSKKWQFLRKSLALSSRIVEVLTASFIGEIYLLRKYNWRHHIL